MCTERGYEQYDGLGRMLFSIYISSNKRLQEQNLSETRYCKVALVGRN